MPGYLDTIKEWFRVYKLAEGKKENVLGADGELQNQEYDISLRYDLLNAHRESVS